MTTKEKVIEMINGMPPRISVSEIVYRLHVIDEIRKGEEDIKNGRIVNQSEMGFKAKTWK